MRHGLAIYAAMMLVCGCLSVPDDDGRSTAHTETCGGLEYGGMVVDDLVDDEWGSVLYGEATFYAVSDSGLSVDWTAHDCDGATLYLVGDVDETMDAGNSYMIQVYAVDDGTGNAHSCAVPIVAGDTACTLDVDIYMSQED